MSSVFYRWGARRDESRITFDGTHISVFDLKREIILNNKMGNGKDFDIGVFDNVTGEGMFLVPFLPKCNDCVLVVFLELLC
jgi:protein MPE1